MNVTPIVNTGLRFDLKHYQALKTSYAGTTLWFVNNSELLRNKLYPFLPRMEYDAGSGTVTASIVENGRELLSTSESATPSLNNVPVSELQKLENLIRDLLAEAAKSDTPDNVKQLVNAFPLPKPNSMPECYRLYGTGPNKRLAIVWGLARKDAEGNEDVSSVVSLKDFTYGLEYTPKKSYTWLWILLGIAAAGIGIYYTSGHQEPPFIQQSPGEEAPVIVEEAGEIVVLTDEQKQLPVPRQLEILQERETAVAQQISEIEAKQNELREKLATMDQQSAEAEASHKALADLLARHNALKAELDAIRTTREKLENPTGGGQGSDTINEEEPSGVTPADGEVTPENDEEAGEIVVLTDEQKQLPVPRQLEILQERETAVAQQISEIEAKQNELREKLATMDQQSAEAEASHKALADLLARHNALKAELDAIRTTREKLENPTGGGQGSDTINEEKPSGVTTEGGVKVPSGVTPEDGVKVPSGVTPEDGVKVPSGVTPEGGVKVPSGVAPEDGEEKPTVVTTEDGEEEPTVVTTEDGEEVPSVVEPYSPLTEAEKQLPVEEQLKVLDRKEKKVKEEVDKLESEQAKLQEELEAIAEKQKHSAEVVDKLTKLLREYEALAAELKRDDISPEERARLTERKKELEEEIAQAESQLETVPYNEKKARLNAIDQQLKESKEKSRQIAQAREALQSSVVATPPREINVEIYKADDYKVTHISHEAIDGSDKVRLKLNISALNANQKFTRITVDGVQANADGDVEIELTNESQRLQLKIWVDNNPEPQYITPIYVNKSVIEK